MLAGPVSKSLKGKYALMTLHFQTPKLRQFVLILFVFISLCLSSTVLAKRKHAPAGRGKSARAEKGRRLSARDRRSARRGDRRSARASRRGRGGRMSARDVRRQRALIAREQASSLKSLERRLHRSLTKRERAAELRRIELSHRRAIEEARRRAEAARLAAIARQRALDQAMRNEVQAFIGKDDIAGEDPEVRRVAINALGNHAGTVVVMDPMTGKIYSVVNQEWALRRGFKPCSTIKLVTGVAGLSEKVIPPVEVSESERYRMDLTSALAHSNNPYFEQVGSRLGFDKMVTYARELGLGEKTGANVSYEFPGRLPEMKPGFVMRRMFSYADGFEVTPMQLGTLVSAMANGGKLLVPQTPHAGREQSKFNVKVRRQLEIGTDVWQRMVPGMVGSVNYGSGRKAYDPAQTVAGKTGTCIGQGGWVGLFTSYAPLANPRLAVVVITQGTDAHRHVPAAVAGEIYRELNHRFGTPTNMQVAATLDDEEKDVADADAAETGDTTTTGDAVETQSATAIAPAPTANKPAENETTTPRSTVKRVVMPIEKRSATASAPAPTPSKPVQNEPATPRGTVKPVLMPIERRVPESQKQDGSNPIASKTPATPVLPGDQRPRRAQPDKH